MNLIEMISSRLVGRRIVEVYGDEESEQIGQVIQSVQVLESGDGEPLLQIMTEVGDLIVIDPLSEIMVN